MEGIRTEVHAGLRRSSAGLPVVEPKRRTGLHRQRRTLGRTGDARIGVGKDSRRIVKILVDLLEDVVFVRTSDLVRVLQRNILRIVRDITEEENLVGVEDGAEELGLARILGDLFFAHRLFRLVKIAQDGVRTGYSFVMLGPAIGHPAGRAFQRSDHKLIELRALVPVVGPAVGVPEPAALVIPQVRIIERVKRIGNLLLVGKPVLAGTLGKRGKVEIDAARKQDGSRNGGKYVLFHFHRDSGFIQQRQSSGSPEPAGTAVPPRPPATCRRTGGRRRSAPRGANRRRTGRSGCW